MRTKTTQYNQQRSHYTWCNNLAFSERISTSKTSSDDLNLYLLENGWEILSWNNFKRTIITRIAFLWKKRERDAEPGNTSDMDRRKGPSFSAIREGGEGGLRCLRRWQAGIKPVQELEGGWGCPSLTFSQSPSAEIGRKRDSNPFPPFTVCCERRWFWKQLLWISKEVEPR